MKQTICKYQLQGSKTTLSIPKQAKILTLQTQDNVPKLWVLVNPESEEESRHFEIVGTGHPMDETTRTYIGTFQIANGSLVFHVFELFV